jgi:hypothetical protein
MLFYNLDKPVIMVLLGLLLVTSILIYLSSKAKNVPAIGLTLMYFYLVVSNTVPGAFLLLIDWYEYLPKYQTYSGFVATSIAAVCFGLGVGLVHLLARIRTIRLVRFNVDSKISLDIQAFALMLLGISVIASVGGQFLGGVASISALLSALTSLTTIACFIWIWLEDTNLRSKFALLASLVVFPMYMLIVGGFLGFGLTFVASIVIFFVILKRTNIILVISAPLILFAVFSFTVSYLSARTEFREVVWDASSIDQRVAAFDRLVGQFEWFDSNDINQLRMVDIRMNQNWLVGVAIESVETGKTEISNGKSLANAALAWIPRAIWADKAATAGSGDLVAEITGLEFNKETSIGISHWLELYANFGMPGMFIGMFLLGVVIRLLDLKAGDALIEANFGKFVFMTMMGFGFLNSLGSFSESVSSLAANFFACIVVLYVLNQRFPSLISKRENSSSINTRLSSA